jgi:DnaJ-class molecular chaperone
MKLSDIDFAEFFSGCPWCDGTGEQSYGRRHHWDGQDFTPGEMTAVHCEHCEGTGRLDKKRGPTQ